MNKAAKIFERGLEAIIWIPIIFLSSLLIHNGLLYYNFDMDYGILPEKKEALKDDVWFLCFYVHVIAGIVCLIIPPLIFIGRHFKMPINVHKIIGEIYVWNNLIFVAPTGIYIATYAKGGWWAEVGFIFQGVLLMYFTTLGYRYSKSNIQEHIKYMIRSYAIASSVLMFRVLHIIFMIMKIPYQDNYAISQWLGMSLHMTLAEIVITYIMAKKKIHLSHLKLQI